MEKQVLITGASGLIGNKLTGHLLANGYKVKHLGRKKYGHPKVTEFTWDPNRHTIEDGAIENGDILIHLAGASVGKGRWTENRKQEIIRSRVDSTVFLHQYLQQQQITLQKFIGASAIGFYGLHQDTQAFTETDPPGTDFMARVCQEWEQSVVLFSEAGVPVTIFRIGVVLAREGGALPQLAKPVRLFAGMPAGSGKQMIPWIHIDDLVMIIERAIQEPGMEGIFNAVAPGAVSNADFNRILARHFRRFYIPVGIPGFLLRVVLGEQANIVLNGVNVSPQKLITHGYHFRYPELAIALTHIWS